MSTGVGFHFGFEMAKINFEQVVVKYPIYNARSFSLRNKIVNVTTGGLISRGVNDVVTVEALNGVSFNISNGDRVGLIGHNGAGKTTLLRTIAGIFTPVSGSIEVEGNVVTIIEPSAGMDFELSGYENIYRLCLLQGVPRRDIPAIIPDIEIFTELGDFLGAPVRTYSAGMITRLMFAIATSQTPEILLLDEMLGAGDARFQEKAAERIDTFLEKASIVVLASHSRELIKKYANRFFLLDQGTLKELSIVDI